MGGWTQWEQTSDIALATEARDAWIKTQPSDAQETDDIYTPQQPGVLFTLLVSFCEPRRRAIPPCGGEEERPGASKSEEEKPPSRGAALQASFAHAGMRFPPIPPPLAALQTAGPTTSRNVVALGSASPPRVPSPTHGPFQYQERDASFKKPPISVGYSLCLPVCELLLRLCTSVSPQHKEGKTLGILPAYTSEGRKRERENLV